MTRSVRALRGSPLLAALLALLVLELVAVGLLATRSEATPEGRTLNRMYDATQLSAAEPGTPIRVWSLPGSDLDGDVYGMLYHSRSVRDADIAVSGYLVVPKGPAPEGGRPVVTLAHGTVGMADDCAPSRDPSTDAATINPMLERGWIVVSTDFEGIGGPGRHPYLVGESEARSMIDAVRAAETLLGDDAAPQFVSWGISQGGHASLFAREVAATWAPELEMLGAVAVAPVSDVAAFVAEPTIVPQAVTLETVAGFTAAYPELHAADVLSEQGLEQLSRVDEACAGDLNRDIASMTVDELRTTDPSLVPAWREALELNTPGMVDSDVPVLVVQGNRDPIVPVVTTLALFERLCLTHAPAEIQVIADGSHADVVDLDRDGYLGWMARRFAEEPARSTC